MRSTISLIVIVNVIILAFVTSVGESRSVLRSGRNNLGRSSYQREREWPVIRCIQDNECGLGYCNAYLCECYPGYITWYFMAPCTYEQRKKLTAFLVSFFVGIFGIDWFVLSRGNAGYIIAGIIKFIISSGCCVGWPFFIINSRKKSRQYTTIGNVINVILTVASVIWWLIDWIRILANVFYDGNGAPLQPWGHYFYYYNRIPFRY